MKGRSCHPTTATPAPPTLARNKPGVLEATDCRGSFANQKAVNDLYRELEKLRQRFWPDILGLIQTVAIETSGRESMLWKMYQYQLNTGGKRLRALWPLRLAQILDRDPAVILPFAGACELLHNASLIIDDIQDGDETRRGHPAVWKQFDRDQAINLSIAMLYYAILLADQLKVEAADRREIKRWLATATLEVAEGQCQDLALAGDSGADLQSYLQMADKKTGSFVALPLAGTALLCDQPPNVVSALANAAKHLGVMYQLWNDITDLRGNPSQRPLGADIREGKHGLLVLHCLKDCSKVYRRRLIDILEQEPRQTTDNDITEAIAILERHGSFAFAREEINRQRTLALTQPALSGHPAARLIEELCIFLEALVARDMPELNR